ncbi:hypothetical protein [Bacillus benzoevorans]|uniref:Uncharacterized protein n=1 Tax=Bacillus benzoevorans TaxID=1456 RepID=A0A7X0HT42_9BACI|nr:hypothetical protein [Bacillus benzoevorans]MBB6446363.1 hypothetical protein [Bacillus benzoevorans]
MSIPTNDSKGGEKGKYQPGSGTKYHKEHAAHVPDYGGNSMEPSAKEITKSD